MKLLFAALALMFVSVTAQAGPSANLSILVVPPSTGYCSAPPPPEAVAAGMTKLAFCLDGGSTFAANLDNWLKCPDTNATAPLFWLGSNGSGLDCHHLWSQKPDPVSGQLVLDLHWPGLGSLYTMDTCNPCVLNDPPSATEHSWSVGHYTEWRVRLTPSAAPGTRHDYGPSLFEWSNGGAQGGHGPIENDVTELNGGGNNGTAIDMAIHDWGVGNLGGGLATGAQGSSTMTVTSLTGVLPDPYAPPIHPMCIDGPGIPHRALFTWTVTGTTTLTITLANTDWIAYSAGTLPVSLNNTPITWGYCSTGYDAGQYTSFNSSVMHTYGTLQTTDGSTYIQQCGFLDGKLAPVSGGGGYGFPNNCGQMNLTKETFHYTQPHHLVFWGGTAGNPTPTDEYIAFIRVWECPNGLPDGPDVTCAGPKQLPSTIDLIR